MIRTYTTHSENGKVFHPLVTWSQRQCEKCHRFIAKHQQKYCTKCAPAIEKEQSLTLDRKESHRLSCRIWDSTPKGKESHRLAQSIYNATSQRKEQMVLRHKVYDQPKWLESVKVGDLV